MKKQESKNRFILILVNLIALAAFLGVVYLILNLIKDAEREQNEIDRGFFRPMMRT